MTEEELKKRYPEVYDAFEDKMQPGTLTEFINEYEEMTPQDRLLLTLNAMESDAAATASLMAVKAIFGVVGGSLEELKGKAGESQGDDQSGADAPLPPRKGGLPQA